MRTIPLAILALATLGALAAMPAASAEPVCIPLVNPNEDTNCVEVQPDEGYCALSYYPNYTGSTGTYVGCVYPAGSGRTVCAAAHYTPSTGYNEGYGCVAVLSSCPILGIAVSTHDNDGDFLCIV